MKLTKNDKEEIEKRRNKTEKEIKNADDIVLIHITNFFPEQGIIKSPKDAGVTFKEEFEGHPYEVPRQRDTVHFVMNGEVENNTGGNWDDRKYAIVIPLKNIDKDKFIGGTPVDFYSDGSVTLPDGSYIICSHENSEKNKGSIGEGIEIIEADNDNIKGYANAFIDKLGYKVENIGAYAWGEEEDNKIANEIIMKDFQQPIHAASSSMEEERFYEDSYRTASIIKIIKDKNLDTKNIENYLYNDHGTPMGMKVDITSDNKYFDFFNKILKDISDIELPDSVINEIIEISKGNISEETKNKLDRRTLAFFNEPGHGTIEAVEKVLRKRLLGEVEIERFNENIEENASFSDIVKVYNDNINEFTSSERRREFFRKRDIKLSKDEEEILENPELRKFYLKMEQIKSKPYKELTDIEKEDLKQIIMIYEKNNSFEMIDNYYITREMVNGTDYMAVMRRDFDRDLDKEKEKLGNRVQGVNRT